MQQLTFLSFKFQRECIDSWLLQQRNTCPLDEYVAYNPLTLKDTPAKHGDCPPGSHANASKLAKQVEPEICVSGNRLFLKYHLNIHQKVLKVASKNFLTDTCQSRKII